MFARRCVSLNNRALGRALVIILLLLLGCSARGIAQSKETAETYLRQQNYSAAINAFNVYVQTPAGSDDYDAYRELASAYTAQHQYSSALDAALKAVQYSRYDAPHGALRSEDRVLAYLELAWAYRGLQRQSDAIEALQHTVALYENDVTHHDEDAMKSLLRRNLGGELVRGRRYDEGIAMLRSASKLDSRDAKIYYWLGAAYLNTGSLATAARMFEIAAAKAPTDAGVYEWLATAYDYEGLPQQALAAAQTAISLGPVSSVTHTRAAEAALDLAQYDEVAGLGAKGDESAEPLAKFAALLSAGEPQVSPRSDYETQYRFWRDVYTAYPWHRGLDFSGDADPQAWARAAEQSGNTYSALTLYAMLFRNCRMDDPSSARMAEQFRQKVIALYHRATIKPRPNALAVDLARMGRQQAELAIRATRDAVQGHCLSCWNRFESAVEFYKLAIDQAPWWAEAYWNLAQAQRVSGKEQDRSDMAATLKMYLALEQNPASRKKALALLEGAPK